MHRRRPKPGQHVRAGVSLVCNYPNYRLLLHYSYYYRLLLQHVRAGVSLVCNYPNYRLLLHYRLLLQAIITARAGWCKPGLNVGRCPLPPPPNKFIRMSQCFERFADHEPPLFLDHLEPPRSLGRP